MRVLAAVCSMNIAVASLASGADAATFRFQPIAVYGSTQVEITGINDEGTLIGLVTLPQDGLTGFVLQGSTLSFLFEAYPTTVNAAGEVAGVSGSNTGFLWQNGKFITEIPFRPGFCENMAVPPLLNRRGRLAYSDSTQAGSCIVYAGRADGLHHDLQAVRGLSNYAIVQSITSDGTMAGYEIASIQGERKPVVFVGKDGFFDELVSPTLGAAFDGFVNDRGEVAFTDGNQGYVFEAGHTSSFILPGKPFNVEIQAINNQGRVVGVYTDNSSPTPLQRGFLYSGGVVSSIGGYATSDSVQLALSQNGAMTLSLMSSLGVPISSYKVRCDGTGC